MRLPLLCVAIAICNLPDASPFSPPLRPSTRVVGPREYRSSATTSSLPLPILNDTILPYPIIDINVDSSVFPSLLPWNNTEATEQIQDLGVLSSSIDTVALARTERHLLPDTSLDYDNINFERYHVVNNIEDITERLLSKQSAAASMTHAYHINKSFSFLDELSKQVQHETNGHTVSRRLLYTTVFHVNQRSSTRNVMSLIRKHSGLFDEPHTNNSISAPIGTSIKKSLAKYDIFHWLDHLSEPGKECLVNDVECKYEHKTNTHESCEYESLSLDLIDEIRVPNPGYVRIMKKEEGANTSSRERLWMTGFSLTNQKGELHSFDVGTGRMSTVSDKTASAIKWPNEVESVPKEDIDEDALLVTDGFLVPGKDKGGLYIVKNPGDEDESRFSLTGVTDWFYHKAVWIDLTGDGRQSILCARAKIPLLSNGGGEGQLVWLERPMPHSYDTKTGAPLDEDGLPFDPFGPRHMPWKMRVLDEGPDVMFSIADLDPEDDTVEIIASQFFSKQVTLHSLQIGPDPQVVFSRIIDDRCGSAFSSVLADLDGPEMMSPSTSNIPLVLDNGSTVASLDEGDKFSHLLVTSHECSSASSSTNVDATSSVATDQSKTDGGSLFAYRVPTSTKGAWKTDPWQRSVIATGFKVESQLSNMINPGAPGFCYTFSATREGLDKDKNWQRPLIGLSGDCAESAYILRPIDGASSLRGVMEDVVDRSTKYALMSEIKCGSTVGSLAIGYDDLISSKGTTASQHNGYAKIYVPCFEQDKVLVFAMGSSENEQEKSFE